MNETFEPLLYAVGDKVEKITGDYHIKGTVVAAFNTLGGKSRFVVELEAVPGMLMIYSRGNLRRAAVT